MCKPSLHTRSEVCICAHVMCKIVKTKVADSQTKLANVKTNVATGRAHVAHVCADLATIHALQHHTLLRTVHTVHNMHTKRIARTQPTHSAPPRAHNAHCANCAATHTQRYISFFLQHFTIIYKIFAKLFFYRTLAKL